MFLMMLVMSARFICLELILLNDPRGYELLCFIVRIQVYSVPFARFEIASLSSLSM